MKLILGEIADSMLSLGKWLLIMIVAIELFAEQYNEIVMVVAVIAAPLLLVGGFYLRIKHKENERLLTESHRSKI